MYDDFRISIWNFFPSVKITLKVRKFYKLLADSNPFKFKGHISVALCLF